MATLRDLRKRIASTKSTRKITKAMKMIAAVRLRKAAEAIQAARPYAKHLHEMLSHLAAHLGEGVPGRIFDRNQPVKTVELVIITSDRGLCGGFNSNLLRQAERYRREHAGEFEVRLTVIGRKGHDFFNTRGIAIRKYYPGVFENFSLKKAQDIAFELAEQFTSGSVDRVEIAYNEFKSAIAQNVSVSTFLPFTPIELSEEYLKKAQASDYDYEPGQREIFDAIVPRYFASQLYRALLESQASEYGARMTAMDSATNNASDMIGSLTLQYNRARQASITKELMEIIGGSEALKG